MLNQYGAELRRMVTADLAWKPSSRCTTPMPSTMTSAPIPRSRSSAVASSRVRSLPRPGRALERRAVASWRLHCDRCEQAGTNRDPSGSRLRRSRPGSPALILGPAARLLAWPCFVGWKNDSGLWNPRRPGPRSASGWPRGSTRFTSPATPGHRTVTTPALGDAQDTAVGAISVVGSLPGQSLGGGRPGDLSSFPLLRDYLEAARGLHRQTRYGSEESAGWYRTIDRVHIPLTDQRKLYVPDIKERFNPVLDEGKSYPHHNLYFITSHAWDLESARRVAVVVNLAVIH